TMDPSDSNNALYDWRTNLKANWILVRDDNVHDYCNEWDLHRPPFLIIIDQNGYEFTKVEDAEAFNSEVRHGLISLLF
ncbi:MAG: hypothetical protein ACW99L_09665, partial [Promethearchaeota archaeon]